MKLMELRWVLWYAEGMDNGRTSTSMQGILATAENLYETYSTERLSVRLEHLLGLRSAMPSTTLDRLIDASVLALQWKELCKSDSNGCGLIH